jgi:hypothetical protein
MFISAGRSLFKSALFMMAAGSMAVAVPQNSKDVNVVNTPTVNVSTLPPVSGSVAISNTPSVNIANTPTVQLSTTTPLIVKTDPSTPLIVRDADNPARNFFQQHFGFIVPDGSFSGTVDLGTVPANSVLVIEYLNLQVRFPGAESMTEVVFQSGSQDTLAFIPAQSISNTGDSTWIVSQPVKIYVPANTSMKLFFGRTSSVGNSQFAAVEISGYLLAQ